MRCIYSAVRFVPDPARGEFVNVGVLVGDPGGGQAALHLVDNPKRAQALDDKGLLVRFWSYVQELSLRVDSGGFTEGWLQERWMESNNVLQFSEPAPVRTTSLDVAVKRLSAELLIDPPIRSRESRPTRKRAVADMRRRYVDAGLERERNFWERPLVSGPNHGERFDFAVANGEAVQLTQAWNFRKKDITGLTEAAKAWAWTVQDIRQAGGEAVSEDKTIAVPADVDVAAVYIAPTNQPGRNAFEEAEHAFGEVDAIMVSIDDTAGIADRATELLAESS